MLHMPVIFYVPISLRYAAIKAFFYSDVPSLRLRPMYHMNLTYVAISTSACECR